MPADEPSQHDIELSRLLLSLTPLERLRALRHYWVMHEKAMGADVDPREAITLTQAEEGKRAPDHRGRG